MDTVDLVLSALGALVLIAAALTALSLRLWYALRIAQTEIARQDAQTRPRSPQSRAAGYDTGLVEKPV